MANNHGADYGRPGCTTPWPRSRRQVPGDRHRRRRAQAIAPYRATIDGVGWRSSRPPRFVIRRSQNWTATPSQPGRRERVHAAARGAVRAAKAAGDVAWCTCTGAPSTRAARTRISVQRRTNSRRQVPRRLSARTLTCFSARDGGRTVCMSPTACRTTCGGSFGNEQDDNGVLTLTVRGGRVVGSRFAPAHLDDSGVPVPASGATAARIEAEWERDRECADLSATSAR